MSFQRAIGQLSLQIRQQPPRRSCATRSPGAWRRAEAACASQRAALGGARGGAYGGGAEEERPPQDAWLGPVTGSGLLAFNGRPVAPSPRRRGRRRRRAACACEMWPRAARTRAAAAAVAEKWGAASSARGAQCMRASTRALGSRRPRRLHKHLFRTRSPRWGPGAPPWRPRPTPGPTPRPRLRPRRRCAPQRWRGSARSRKR